MTVQSLIMPLQPGTTLGPYHVTAKIGEGGMGEVWQVRDTKLDRDVALKVLPEAFTSDPDRLARFEREAKVLVSLNPDQIEWSRSKGECSCLRSTAFGGFANGPSATSLMMFSVLRKKVFLNLATTSFCSV